MTDFFQYADLTYPELDALPRHVPLIIPLGDGYDLKMVSAALEEPLRIGLLPAIPFGWPGSVLGTRADCFNPMVRNLVNSLNDSGFWRVLVLAPPGVDLGLGVDRLVLPGHHAALPEPLPPDGSQEKVILIPIGHIEQHAFHLPMSTDFTIIDVVGRGTAAALPDAACCLPAMPYGASTHHTAFCGTLNCGGRAFEDFWVGIIDTLVGRGFTRMYLISGHGGNCSFLVNVIKYAGDRHPHIFCATAWVYLSGPQGAAVLEKYRRSPLGGMGHACELETSLMLHLTPDLVHMDRVVDEIDFVTTPSYYMDWLEGGALSANPSWLDDTATGAYGAGSFATVEHGKIWLEAAIQEKAAHVLEIIEQSERRNLRRQNGYGLWKGGRNEVRQETDQGSNK